MNKLLLVPSELDKDQYGGLNFKSASDIPSKRIQWYWSGMIAEGKFHVFAGDAGIGKTQILCNITATVSRGGIFSGEKEPCIQGKVLYLTGEDGASDTIIPRLKACGATLDNVTVLDPLKADGKLFSLSENMDSVADMVSDDGNYKLFIIDPVTAFCDDKFDNNSVTSVRSLATKLSAFAEDTGVAVIGLTHLTKDDQRKAVNRILGSGAWVHASRVVLGAVHADGQYYFGKWKANITDCTPVYTYRMTERPLDDLGYVHYIDFDDYPMLGRSLDEFQSVSTGRGATGASVRDILERLLQDGDWHLKEELVDAVGRQVECNIKTIERVAFDEMSVDRQNTNETPTRVLWRLPS